MEHELPKYLRKSEEIIPPETPSPSISKEDTSISAVFTDSEKIIETQFASEHGEYELPRTSTPDKQVSTGSTNLASINYTREKQLTPKKKILYNELKDLKKKLYLSKKKNVCCKKRLLLARDTSKPFLFESSDMDPLVYHFFRCQIRNKPKHVKGRQFTLDDKIMALSLLKESGRAFRMLSTIFVLPSRQTLISLLNKIPLYPGINQHLFNNITANINTMKNHEKYCSLIFDEMALEQHVEWDKKQYYVIGVEDTGFHRTHQIADHALVFLIRGIFANWKQPIVYTFCEATTKTKILQQLIKEIIKMLHNSGLDVLATVCDQGATNVGAINGLIQETREYCLKNNQDFTDNIFRINGNTIIPIYDPPHLVKGIRNNFLNKDIIYFNDDMKKCCALWDDIVTGYRIDAPSGSLRLMQKLTDFHVLPSKIKKIKVSFCTQIFSKQVACSIYRMSIDNATSLDGMICMRSEAVETAHLLHSLMSFSIA